YHIDAVACSICGEFTKNKKGVKLIKVLNSKDNFFVRKISHIQETMLDLGFTLRVVNTSLRLIYFEKFPDHQKFFLITVKSQLRSDFRRLFDHEIWEH
ncbi:hypothetical protein BpHYR1_026660, partial [Brachionus plicatilis]